MKGSVAVGLLLLVGLSCFTGGSGASWCYVSSASTASLSATSTSTQSASFNYTVTLVTSMGTIIIGLFDDMPITTGNFENLTQLGYYDGTIFHRVVHDFVIQGGDLSGKSIVVPTIPDELPNKHSNIRGSVAMAKTTQPNSAASQFYINLVDNTYLDANYSVFGQVIQEMDVVDSIGSVQTDVNDRPLQDVTVLAARLQPVGPVFIRADGSIDPPAAPISTSDNVTYTLTGNIISDASGIVVERDNIVVDGSGFAVVGTGVVSSQGIGLFGRSLVTIQNTTIKDFYSGIWLGYSTNNSVSGNTITNNSDSGIWLDYLSNYNSINGNTITNNNKGIWLGFSSDYNSIIGNTVANNNYGFRLEYSWNNSIIRNIISNNNLYGIWLYGSSYNTFCHNNFVNNTHQAKSIGSTSFWDNGCEGNYWSDYNGTDSDNDGVGDTSLPWEGVDNCPLMNIYWNPCDTNHDLHVDMRDLSISAEAFGSSPGDPFWNPHADITGPEQLVPDGKVNIRDTGLIGRHFEQHYH